MQEKIKKMMKLASQRLGDRQGYRKGLDYIVWQIRTVVRKWQLTGGRLGAGGGTIQFMRDTNVHVPTSLSAALHPRLRQTASYLQAFTFIFILVCSVIY